MPLKPVTLVLHCGPYAGTLTGLPTEAIVFWEQLPGGKAKRHGYEFESDMTDHAGNRTLHFRYADPDLPTDEEAE